MTNIVNFSFSEAEPKVRISLEEPQKKHAPPQPCSGHCPTSIVIYILSDRSVESVLHGTYQKASFIFPSMGLKGFL